MKLSADGHSCQTGLYSSQAALWQSKPEHRKQCWGWGGEKDLLHQLWLSPTTAHGTAHLHCPRTSKWNQPMRSQQRFANLWMRKANLWLHSAGFIPATSFPFFAFVGKILGMQPESSEPIGFLQSCRFSPCSTYWTRFFFFLINYPAPSTLFIQCKATVKCHLIIKSNSTHSFWGKGNTQLR